MCGTFLLRLLPPPDIRVLLSTPKETYDLNLNALLSKVTSNISSYNLGSLPSPWWTLLYSLLVFTGHTHESGPNTGITECDPHEV